MGKPTGKIFKCPKCEETTVFIPFDMLDEIEYCPIYAHRRVRMKEVKRGDL